MRTRNIVYFRFAKPTDLDAIVAMCGEHAIVERAQYDPAGKAEKLASFLFCETPRLHCLVAETQYGELVGYASFSEEFSTWDADFYIHVDTLYLKEAYRQGIIGWRFGRRVVEECLKLGHDGIQFQTPPFNETAIRMYNGFGATPKDKIRFYWSKRNHLEMKTKGQVASSSLRLLEGLV